MKTIMDEQHIKVSNVILTNYTTGDIVAYFDLKIDFVRIDNCLLFLNTKNKNFYWKTYPHEYRCRYKFSDKTTYRNYVQITDEYVSKQILKLAQREYYKAKTKFDLSEYKEKELQNVDTTK